MNDIDPSMAYLFDEEPSDISTFSELQRTDLIQGIEQIGSVIAAAAEIGITKAMLQDAISQDPRLAADIELATGRYQANILRRTADLAYNGSRKAVVGGKDKEIVGYDEVPNDTALKLITQMHFADELATVTRQRLTVTPVDATAGQAQMDVSLLDREERKQLAKILHKAKKNVDKVDGGG